MIADGGIKDGGDFAKAIAAGADCVMSGACSREPKKHQERFITIPENVISSIAAPQGSTAKSHGLITEDSTVYARRRGHA